MNRKDLIVAGGVAAVLALGWYQFVWQSQGTAAAQAKADSTKALENVAKLKTQVATLQRAKNELSANEGQVAQILQAIPDTPDASALIKTLQAKAHEHNLVLATVTNGKVSAALAKDPAAVATLPSEIPLTLNLSGHYADIVTFVDELGRLPRLLMVDSLSLSPVNSAAQPGKPTTLDDITATIGLRAFTTEAPAGAASAAAATPTTTAAPAAGKTTTASTAAAAVP